jgi:hypothetical protein
VDGNRLDWSDHRVHVARCGLDSIVAASACGAWQAGTSVVAASKSGRPGRQRCPDVGGPGTEQGCESCRGGSQSSGGFGRPGGEWQASRCGSGKPGAKR